MSPWIETPRMPAEENHQDAFIEDLMNTIKTVDDVVAGREEVVLDAEGLEVGHVVGVAR